MANADCPMCAMVNALAGAGTYQSPGRADVCRKVADLPTAVAVLGHDQFYRGYTLVVARTHARELFELPDPEARQYLADMLTVARAIATALQPRKMNYELLGNTVAHLHWHLFPRHAGDPNPERPVWEHAHPATVPAEQEYAETLAAIRRCL